MGFIGFIAELPARQVQVGKLAVALVQGQPGVERVVDSGEGGMPAGGSEGGRPVADDAGAAAALCLGSFADVVHDVGIEHRYVADGAHGDVRY